jgi:hypothetical protein
MRRESCIELSSEEMMNENLKKIWLSTLCKIGNEQKKENKKFLN